MAEEEDIGDLMQEILAEEKRRKEEMAAELKREREAKKRCVHRRLKVAMGLRLGECGDGKWVGVMWLGRLAEEEEVMRLAAEAKKAKAAKKKKKTKKRKKDDEL